MDYVQRIKLLYNLPKNKNYGIVENEIITMENNHKIKFPKILREYYLILGKNTEINRSFNRLLQPKETGFTKDNYFVFYEENQEIVYWAINKNDLENENQKVFSNYDAINLTEDWFIASETLDGFLLSMAYWNGAMGGLQYNANYSNDNGIENNIIKNVENNFMEIKEITNQQLRFFTTENMEIVAVTFDLKNNYNGIYIGTNNEKVYKNTLEKINIEWHYRSDEDDNI